MIVARMMGGLGNQLFIYAAARCLAMKNAVPLKLDIVSGFKNDRQGRRYCLDRFRIETQIASPYESFDFWGGRHLQFLLRGAWKAVPLARRRYIAQTSIKVDPEMLHLRVRGRVFLDGYWQSEKYFVEVADTIREEFQLREEPAGRNRELADIMAATRSVSVHVRRGDYVSNPKTHAVHGVCGPDYYVRCFDIVAQRLSDPHFFIFSDDPRWCRENLKPPYPLTYVAHNGAEAAEMDLYLMSRCQHHIIANSSLSWWGAWLGGGGKDQIVLAPRQWFRQPTEDTDDLVPETWVRV